ncbi:hypothetical protein [Castellaniella sp.]|nr:hypothetical protein [Castellaniella sp.]
MSLITSLIISSAILVIGSAGLAVFAWYLRDQDEKERRHRQQR